MAKKERYNITLDPRVVDNAQHQAMDSKLSPIINNLLKVWIEYRDEVENLFHKLKENKK